MERTCVLVGDRIMKLTDIFFITIAVAGMVWLLSQAFLVAENPSYSFNKEHAEAIFYKYDLKNNSSPQCNEYGCASINPIIADAWKELCSMDGNCDPHDAFHFWYSKNSEVEKVKSLWMKLNTT